jgi:tRNA(Glu) U13 pseudouridine synthase TruD
MAPNLCPRSAPTVGSARIRSCPEDFVVEELIELRPEPPGEHLWLRVQKRNENTEYVRWGTPGARTAMP